MSENLETRKAVGLALGWTVTERAGSWTLWDSEPDGRRGSIVSEDHCWSMAPAWESDNGAAHDALEDWRRQGGCAGYKHEFTGRHHVSLYEDTALFIGVGRGSGDTFPEAACAAILEAAKGER